MTTTPYRVFFTNLGELSTWLRVRGWRKDRVREVTSSSSFVSTVSHDGKPLKILSVDKDLFDDGGKLVPLHGRAWLPSMVQVVEEKISDDDIPF